MQRLNPNVTCWERNFHRDHLAGQPPNESLAKKDRIFCWWQEDSFWILRINTFQGMGRQLPLRVEEHYEVTLLNILYGPVLSSRLSIWYFAPDVCPDLCNQTWLYSKTGQSAFDLYIKFCRQETASVSVFCTCVFSGCFHHKMRSRHLFGGAAEGTASACRPLCAQEQQVTYSACTLDTIVFFSFGTTTHKACAARNPNHKLSHKTIYCLLL